MTARSDARYATHTLKPLECTQMKFLPAMVELPEDTNPEYVRDDVVQAVRAVYDERAVFDLGRPQLPSFDTINFTPVPPCSNPVML